MRVNKFGGTNKFQEFDVTFTIESEEEAKALYAIFNYCPNLDILPEEVGDRIRGIIVEKYSDFGSSTLIARGVHHKEFYRGKKED